MIQKINAERCVRGDKTEQRWLNCQQLGHHAGLPTPFRTRADIYDLTDRVRPDGRGYCYRGSLEREDGVLGSRFVYNGPRLIPDHDGTAYTQTATSLSIPVRHSEMNSSNED